VIGENSSKRIWIGASVALVIALAAAVWFGRPAYRRYQAERSFKQARAFLEKGDLNNAALCLRQTLVRNSSNVGAARQMAELATRIRSPAALGWWRRVVELQPALENKVLLAAVALQIEKPPFPIATQTLEETRTLGQTNVAYHLVAAQRAIRLQESADAQTHLQTAIRLEPTNRQHQLNLAVLRLQSSEAALAESAQRELTALALDPVLGQHALRSLAAEALRKRRLPEAEALSQQLLALPQATFEDRLQHLTILHEANQVELPARIEQAQQLASSNAPQVALMAVWLNTHRRAPEALAWLKTLPAKTRDTLPVPQAEAECFVAARDWEGLLSRLDAQRWDELEFLRLAFVARAHREQGRRGIADSCWRRAMNATAARTEYAAQLMQLSAEWGWQGEAEDLSWVVAQRAPQETWPLQALLRHYTATTNTAGLYRVHQALLERDPKSLTLKNNLAMYGLLLNRDLKQACTLAREVYEAEKTNAFFVSTYAFSLHVQGQSPEGLRLMQALPEAELRRPEIATYYAVLLSAAGEREKAGKYLTVAEKGQLLPEEHRLLAQARGQN